MAHEVGDTIADRYRLDGKLGEGGMGVVFAATHNVTRKRVALKFLRSDLAADTRTRQRFVREARAACAVRHANVVQIHDVLELFDGSPVMVMDLLEGETLAGLLDRKKRLDAGELARLILPVLSAVGTAHEMGIVHRDLKPENIFLARTRDGVVDVKVLDFGIAKLTATEGDAAHSGGITGTGSMLGTPYYMSPEQAFGEKDIDHRADIWSLGVIFYECLSGVRPTQADNIGQVLKIVMTDAIRPLTERVPDVPSEVAELVARMLQRDRSLRPKDLREIVEVLRPFGVETIPSFGPPKAALSTITIANDTAAMTPDEAALGDTIEATPAASGERGTTNDALSTTSQPNRGGRRGVYVAVAIAVAGAVAVGGWRLSTEHPATPADPSSPASATPPPATPPSVAPAASPPPVASSAMSAVDASLASLPSSSLTVTPRAAPSATAHKPPPTAAASSAPPPPRPKTSTDPGSYQ